MKKKMVKKVMCVVGVVALLVAIATFGKGDNVQAGVRTPPGFIFTLVK